MITLVLGFWEFNLWTKKEPSVHYNTVSRVADLSVGNTNKKSISFLFGGDLMFDRLVNHTFKDSGFDQIFADLNESFFQKDIVFANMEGPISDKPIDDNFLSGSMVFNMPPSSIDTLKRTKINGVSLANNHTLNAGNSGFFTTQNLLKTAGIKYGGYENKFDTESIIRYDTKIPVSIIVFNYLSYKNIDEVATAISREKTTGRFVVIFPHWGNEYDLKHNNTQEFVAHKLIDAGGDIVIGTHPHVVQDVELYRNHAIFYSLGNFVFDQLFSKDTQEGLLLTGKLTEKELTINLNPIKAEKMKLRPMNAIEKKDLLDRINDGQETINLEF